MKVLCIVDTCSLIYLSEIELANKSLHRWLWDEFDVTYSRAAWNEIQNQMGKMGQSERGFKREWSQHIWRLSTMPTCESALFAPPFFREIETRMCGQCKRPFWKSQPFEPDLDREEDRGERHNCCVALDAILTKHCQQIIFLTDDDRAIRDYVAPVFDVFPLGSIWSSHDLVLYLFMRHRRHIPQKAAKNAIQDVVAKATQALRGQPEERVQKAKSKWMKKHAAYQRKVERVDQVLSQFRGGHQ